MYNHIIAYYNWRGFWEDAKYFSLAKHYAKLQFLAVCGLHFTINPEGKSQ